MIEGSSLSVRGDLSPQIALKLAKSHLESAHKSSDSELAAALYNEARAVLSRMEQPTLDQDQSLRDEITYVLAELDGMLASLRQPDSAQVVHTEAGDSSDAQTTTDDSPLAHDDLNVDDVSPRHIFVEDKRPPAIEIKLPECGTRLVDTPQLAYCLGLLQAWHTSPGEILGPALRNWLQATVKNEEEVDRFKILATDVIAAFVREGTRNPKLISEAVLLAPVLDKAVYRHLLEQLCNGIELSVVLDSHQLEGLAQVIRSASADYLEAADLRKILGLLKKRLSDIHKQSSNRIYESTLAVSNVIDAMTDTNIKGLDFQQLYQYLAGYMDDLKATSDPRLVFQGAYTYQALQYVTEDETVWQSTQKKIKATNGLMSLDHKEILQHLQRFRYGHSSGAYIEERGRSLLNHLQDGASFDSKQPWYPTLRIVNTLFCCGQFAVFKKLAAEMPCRRDPAFQWGLCQLLGDLAVNSEWDTKTRMNAVAFFEDIYLNDDVWGQQGDINELVVTILTQLVSTPDGAKQAANTFLRRLRTDKPMEKSTVQVRQGTGRISHLVNAIFPSFATPSLLDRVQDTPGVEGKLYQVRKEQLEVRQDAVYVQLQAKVTLEINDLSCSTLTDNVKEFLASDRKVLLLLGDSGSGKSTFCHVLKFELWKSYKGMECHIPLNIELTTIDKPIKDMVSEQLQAYGFTEEQIKELKSHRKFVLICDGYDQIPQPDNFYTKHKLNQPGGWNVKIVICSRSEYFQSNPLESLYPTDQNCQVQPELFQQVVIEPFTRDQVGDYISQFVATRNPPWKKDDYLRVLDQNPCLKDLSRNPLLLSLTLEALPRLAESQHDFRTKGATRVEVYDEILVRWFQSSKSRIEMEDSDPEESESVARMTNDDFISRGTDYLKDLAVAIYKNQGGVPFVEYSHFKHDGTWKENFFSEEKSNRIMRKGSPLKSSGFNYQFIHSSLLEYGLSLVIFDPQLFGRVVTPKLVSVRRGSVDSVMSFESNGPDEEAATTIEQGPDLGSPLIWRNIVNDTLILRLLEERVQLEPLFGRQLKAFIELSKMDKKWRTAAVNSITILVGAGVSFGGADLRGIQVPGANLSHGKFESAQLQGADLRKAILCNSQLNQADLSRAQLKGAQFGELPYIPESTTASGCAYSSDGRYLAISLDSGSISLYSTTNWERTKTLAGHCGAVNCIAFSTRGCIISGGTDKTVRVWDFETGECVKTLSDHTAAVYAVACSPQQDQVASGSDDWTVRLWDMSQGTHQHTLRGHDGAIQGIVFSPNGRQLASGSKDSTVRLWDAKTGASHSTLSGHDDMVCSIAYSPQGHLIVSGGADKTVRLWDVKSGTCQSILRGHFGCVWSVSFSPLGNLIATGSEDKSVRLWNVGTRACCRILRGHEGSVKGAVFSSSGDLIASCDKDATLRLWDVETRGLLDFADCHDGSYRCIATSSTRDMFATGSEDGIVQLWDMDTKSCIRTLIGHSKLIKSISFSSKGDQVASGSDDGTVRVWDVTTGVCQHVLNDHKGPVLRVEFSPKSNRIASTGSTDNTIRIWDSKTGASIRTFTLQGAKGFTFSPTNGQLTFNDGSGKLQMWDIESGSHYQSYYDEYEEEDRGSPYLVNSYLGNSYLSNSYLGNSYGTKPYRSRQVVPSRAVPSRSGQNTGYKNLESITISPAGDMIATVSSGSGGVQLWDASKGSSSRTLCDNSEGGDGVATSVVFSPKGDQIAFCRGKTVQLWSVASGQRQAIIKDFQGSVHSIAWCPSLGQDHLLVGEEHGTVQVWKVSNSGGQYDMGLIWTSDSRLTLTGASMSGAQGLSDWNKRLLKQRGAVNVPDLS